MRIRWGRVIGLLVVMAAITAALGHELLASSSSTVESWSPPALPHIDVPGGDRDLGLIGDVAKLDPALLDALGEAAADAEYDGVQLVVDSGWRSPEHQAELLREAVAKYGSMEEAARWVATPETSAHVSGDAVDIGPSEATEWLSAHGAGYGLCQIYANEPWHYELRPEAVDNGCPPMYPDPTYDPRMHQ